jgi:ABC-type transporter Mla MlaB component
MVYVPGLRRLDLRMGECVRTDLGAIDALARLQLEVRRTGYELTLLDVPDDLRALIDFAGLGEVLRVET